MTHPPSRLIRDDIAYMLPMGTFLVLLWCGGNWKGLYPQFYVARAVVAAGLLIGCWRHYTKIRWNHWWLGAILGVVGIVQWVGMQFLLQRIVIHGHALFAPPEDAFNPTHEFSSSAVMWGWIAVRIFGAALVVPVMEELFWRDFLWRSVIAPNDFKLAQVGEWDWKALLVVTAAFASVHGNAWLTAIVWGLMIAGLLLYTKSIGACIVMHAVTNALLAGYVLYTHDWGLW